MRIVYKHEDIMMVSLAEKILKLHGIDTYIKNEHGYSMSAHFGLSNTVLELWLLNDQDYDEALSILEKEIVDPPVKTSWVCRKCGEKNEGSFELCWNCQHINRQEDDAESPTGDPDRIVANSAGVEDSYNDLNRNRNTLFSGLSGEDIFLITVILCLLWVFIISMLNT